MKGNQVIGNYRLYKTIGEGAFAKVRCKQILKYKIKILYILINIVILNI